MGLCLGMNKPVKSLWVRTGGDFKMGNIWVGVCYRPPYQEEVHEYSIQIPGRNLMFTGHSPHRGLQPS